MPYTDVPTQPITDTLMSRLQKEKEAAKVFVERRFEDWNDNYELYRNKIKTNRLTQRQAVNIPLMKETIKTLLSKVDDAPIIEWHDIGGDELKELIFQQIWNDDFERLNLEGVDIQDKKTVLLYGRGFKKLNWSAGRIDVKALDIYDVLVDPLTDPLDIETARFVIHKNIFRSLREVLADPRYTAAGKEKLKVWLSSPEGIIQSSKDREQWEKKLDRLKAMDLDSKDFPLFAGGDTIVSLTEHYTNIWDTKTKKFERRVITYANDSIELLDEKLEDLLGVDFYPFVTWAEDIETQDFWSDSVADLIRTPNKIINIWFSQMVENRTLRNFQMHWYDATLEGYQPQTYEPGPGRMLPAPGDPNKTILPVDIQGLDETLTAIQFLTAVVERGSAVTAIEKGQGEKTSQTLGEVKVLVGKAQERIITMAKAYRRSWEELARKYFAIMDANATKKITLVKMGRNDKLWPKTIYPSDWRSERGFKPTVISSSEQEENSVKTLQKFQFALQQFPDNVALRKIAQKRILETLDLSPEELRNVHDMEDKATEIMAQGQNPSAGAPVEAQGAPPESALAASIPSPFAQR